MSFLSVVQPMITSIHSSFCLHDDDDDDDDDDIQLVTEWTQPRADSEVERIDPLRFLAGCRKKRLNQALSVS